MVLRELAAKLTLHADPTGFNKAEAMIGQVKAALVGVGVTLTAGAVYHGLKHLVDETAAAAFESSKNAKMIGISREAYDELGFAAKESGVHVETLQTGLRYLNIASARAGQGGRELGKAFRALGVSPAGKPVDKLLMDIAAGYERLGKSDPRRVLFAREMFGRGGIEMLRLLDKGKEGLAEMREEAHKLGLVFTDEDVEAATDFKKATLTLHSTLESLKRAIAIPLMRELAKGKRELTEWLKANREIIRERVIQFVKILVQTFQAFLSVLNGAIEALVAVGKGIAAVAAHSAVLKGVFIALGVAGALALAPALSGIALLMIALEDIWGWVTGKRKHTIMGELFGDFDKLWGKINPEDNTLVAAAKIMAQSISQAKKDLEWIVAAFGVGPKAKELSAIVSRNSTGMNLLNGAGATSGWLTSGAAALLPGQMGADAAGRRDAYLRQMGLYFGREFLDERGQAAVGILPGGGGVTIGEINVHSTSADPVAVANEVTRQLRVELGAAHAAVAR